MNTKQLQCLLLYLGYEVEPDGIWGGQTERAVKRFGEEYGSSEPAEKALKQAVFQDWKRKKGDFWEDIRYFRREEPYIGCSCGTCGGFPVEPVEALIRLADRVRGHFGRPMIPTSTVRCPAHNKTVGGVAGSRHLSGKAMDFYVQGISGEKVLSYVNQQPETRYAYLVTSDVVHMDVD